MNVCKTTGSAVILAFSKQESVSVGCTSMFWAVVELTLLSAFWPSVSGNWLSCNQYNWEGIGVELPCPKVWDSSYGVIFYLALHCTIRHKAVTGKIPLFCSQLILFRYHLKHHWQQSYKVRKRSSLCRFRSFLELNQHLPIWIAWGSILPISLNEDIPAVTSI